MTNQAIAIEQLGKCYRIDQARRASYQTLRESLTGAVMTPLRRVSGLLARGSATSHVRANASRAEFWALRDLTLDIRQGEVVGIVGRNGAGKSTLLKILTSITHPTEGAATVWGRVGSLLEVGTGFHPELTGRENVFLNGAILGMHRAEIQRKFDEIVAFAEVEKFLETPVKFYSSGMYLRLAFAVASHLEPDILLVDEVLAVGDAAFQKKCMTKMHDVGQQGRTVLFVSHNMPAITGLCERVILLDSGRLAQDGRPHDVVSAYLNTGLDTTASREWADESRAPSGDAVRLRAVRVRGEDGQVAESIDIRRPLRIDVEFEVFGEGAVLVPHIGLTNESGVHLFSAYDVDPVWRNRVRPRGRYTSTAQVPGNFLADGQIFVSAGCVSIRPFIQQQFSESDVVVFRVVDTIEGDTARGDYPGTVNGALRPLLQWQTEYDPCRVSSDERVRAVVW